MARAPPIVSGVGASWPGTSSYEGWVRGPPASLSNNDRAKRLSDFSTQPTTHSSDPALVLRPGIPLRALEGPLGLGGKQELSRMTAGAVSETYWVPNPAPCHPLFAEDTPFRPATLAQIDHRESTNWSFALVAAWWGRRSSYPSQGGSPRGYISNNNV